MSTPNSQSDIPTNNNSDLSLCIPRVFPDVTWRLVKDTFELILAKSAVERVDIIPKTADDGTPFNRVFIHLRFWPKNTNAINMRKLLHQANSVKIVYNEPWFWKVFISRLPKPHKPTYPLKPPFIAQASNDELINKFDEKVQIEDKDTVKVVDQKVDETAEWKLGKDPCASCGDEIDGANSYGDNCHE
mgnify:CR=1 FL=1|jgi:hypothetical protein